MVGRGIVSLISILFLVTSAPGQTSTDTKLIVTALGATPYQSLLFSVDTKNGVVTTLFNDPQGNFLGLGMDSDNVGYVVAYEGKSVAGLHFLAQKGASTSIVQTERKLNPEAKFNCVNLTSEGAWVVGTGIAQGAGRIRSLIPGDGSFHDIDNFPGYEVSCFLIERTRARFILALNGQDGVVCSYDPYIISSRSILASGLGRITDLIQDPDSGGYLVSTRDKKAPILYVGAQSRDSVVKTFTFPISLFPTGTGVDALALDTRNDSGGKRNLWVLVSDRLYRIEWQAATRTLVFPSPVIKYTLPTKQPTAMIMEGDRDFLLTSNKPDKKKPEAILSLRLGPLFKDQTYYLGASLAVQPGIVLARGRMINLAPDPLFFMSLTGQLPMMFEEFTGSTGPTGEVTGRITGPKGWERVLKGLPIYIAGIVIDPAVPGRVRTVTNTVGLILF